MPPEAVQGHILKLQLVFFPNKNNYSKDVSTFSVCITLYSENVIEAT